LEIYGFSNRKVEINENMDETTNSIFRK